MSYRSADGNDDALLTDGRRIRAVIFDLDGTLVDTVPLHALSWIETCKRLGLSIPTMEYVGTLMGLRALDIARRLCGEEIAERALEIKNEIYLSLLNNVKAIDGAPELLRLLKDRGFIVGVVTSSSRRVATKVLEVTGLHKYVDALIAGDDVSRGKPDPEPLLKILNLLGLNVNDVMVVGDSKYDVEMALNAGVKLVFFLGNYSDPRVISIRGLLDIIGYLDQFPIKH
ncbi:HAD family hydrolase [Vulcanisaeta distributa]|uniref:HAD-superfamily hydrolase, subfamily IA, variant 1 n=1 Tax=Vulcanisaeta distributa (strain DSM 14429 / JCM 11212 / NBRC 100878 / IC-017) TaxID=572478 RepID=E1QNV5_VULDI|nr:HAD family phosphatase [Vulcanisaeta distributa]ADN50201.1 HAD-superfamily hydrolase, subfamily IA, variant 1 [Vulcanisaeta distributa DSM 14429]